MKKQFLITSLFVAVLCFAPAVTVAQVLVDFSKLGGSAVGFYGLYGGGKLTTDKMSDAWVNQFGLGLKYGSASDAKKVFHYTLTAGYEVLYGLQIPSMKISSNYSLGEFTVEALGSVLFTLKSGGSDTDRDIDFSLFGGGKLGFPALKDAQGIYFDSIWQNDTATKLTMPNNQISVSM